ncbi:flagellar basal body P-ring formation chaperone FlgA [Pelagibacterium lacus]|uniref:Flagella basal body P-ring formation protein FlgA n=1 Tax=Pelagibacterium lacus TaxID=2282655 RepID=A0A369WA67_9HYPH|nr:flagellar basal body P-ring formation chaperone FlgA [Pelagibacterium lacus]RDE10260.1 flagella basal body P-ring formation protein FlgA [Pelagibacterium lacus]
MFVSLLKRASLSLAIAAIASSAFAMPVLRGDITVSAPIVTIGDLFENAGLKAETAIFRAPAPGTTGTVTLDDIASAAGAAGITEFEPAGLTAIRVSRAGTAIDLPLIADLIESDLRQRGILTEGMQMELSLDAPLPALAATDAARPATLEILRYMPGSASISARFLVSGASAPLDISGQIQLMVEAPHLARTLPEGAVLGADDVVMRLVPLAYAETAGLVAYQEAIGMQLQRQTRAGVMLRPADIAAPQVVGRNETVTIIYREGALTLTATGKALNAASLSQPVSVLNTMSNKVLLGTATGNGTVTILSGPQQVAGL